jgi:hypothetical protein
LHVQRPPVKTKSPLPTRVRERCKARGNDVSCAEVPREMMHIELITPTHYTSIVSGFALGVRRVGQHVARAGEADRSWLVLSKRREEKASGKHRVPATHGCHVVRAMSLSE